MSEGQGRAAKTKPQRFQAIFHRFVASQRALLELAEAVEPHLDEFGRRGITITLPPVEGKKEEKLLGAFRSIEQRSERALGQAEVPDGVEAEPGDDLGKAIAEAYSDRPEILRQMGSVVTAATAAPRHDQLLYSSLLTASVGALEAAVSGVVAQRHALHPKSLQADDISFSLADLEEIDDLEAARELAITKRVDEIMWPGIESWMRWIDRELGEPAEDLAEDWMALFEAVQRRHLFVHTGGVVSRQYLAKVDDNEARLGDQLNLDRAYLESSIQQITIFGARLLLNSWAKWRPEETTNALEDANEFVIRSLRSNEDLTAMCLADTTRAFDGPEEIKLFLRVNGWQAKKRVHGMPEVEHEIREWDTSALSSEFALAKSCLLEDIDKAVAQVPPLVKLGTLDQSKLESWPLFSELRGNEKWKEMMAEVFPEAVPEKDARETQPTIEEPRLGIGEG